MHLTPETTDADLLRLSEPLRATEGRRRELERLARLCTDREVDVKVELDESRALCRPTDDGGYEILVPTEEFGNEVLDLPPRARNRIVQIAFLFHELGHVHYSDFDRFGERRREVDGRWRDLFRAIYNAAEDAVVETQIAAEFDVRDDLTVLNATLVAENDARHRRFVDLFDLGTIDDAPVQTYTVFEALLIGILDRGFVDSGRFEAILDPENPRRIVRNGREDVIKNLTSALEAYVTAMLSEPDGAKRVDHAADFFETAVATFESLPPLQSMRVQTASVRPVDVHPVAGWESAPADQLPDEEAAKDLVSGEGDKDNSEGRIQDERRPPGRVDDEMLRRLSRRVSTRRGRGVTEGVSALEREARALLELLREEENDLEEVIVVEPVENGDRGRWAEAKAASRKLEADLRTRLRRERRPRDRRGQRFGRLDGRRVVAASQGRDRVFARRESGREKDYSCLLVLDRSGSMEGDRIRTAEAATAQLAIALYGVGVDVSVLSVWRDYPCLELPFGDDPAAHVDRIVTGRSSGSTPISDAIAIARERLSIGRGTVPFVVVITDGQPNSVPAYREQLDRCSMPVFGVYVDPDSDWGTSLFDRVVYAEPNAVGPVLEQIVRRLFAHETRSR